ncbi:MAG: serine/threonine-protein kinase, partial [Thermoguttaceae bacterium]
EAAAKLDHPGIVPIFEVGEHEGQHYFSMACVEGDSLARRVAQGVMEPRETAAPIKKVAEAIAYANVEAVIHRDLKPADILVDRGGTPRVTDFGLAKRVEDDQRRLTATGQVLGTPSYMPPEQAAGNTKDNCRQIVGKPTFRDTRNRSLLRNPPHLLLTNKSICGTIHMSSG